jgi:hypothetical protein
MNPALRPQSTSDELTRSLARRFRLLNWAWLVVSIIQAISCLGIVASAWNLHVLHSRWRVPERIVGRSTSVVRMYQNDEAWFLAFLIVNVALGGVIGAVLIVYEFLSIRKQVLDNRHVFLAPPTTPMA